MKKLVSFVSLLLVLTFCLGSFAAAESTVYQLGDKFEDFTVTTYDGRTITLSEVLKEKETVLINFWATWCGPCLNEFPLLEEVYHQYSDQVEVIALAADPSDTDEALTAVATQLGLTFNVARDTAGVYRYFSPNSISVPISIMVDRFGTICFWGNGAMPDAGSFNRLFDAFIGDDYTQSVILQEVPRAIPNVAPSSQEELNAALNAEGGALVFTNGTDPYDWPMIAGEKDGRSVAISSNTGVGNSMALVNTVIDAKAGDVVAVTFKISSHVAMDMMYLCVDGKTVKGFGGEDGWMTYAYAFDTDGSHDVSVYYVNDPWVSDGEDTLWVDSIAHLTGDAAAAALAANPVYPTVDEAYIKPLHENARRIIINDPIGLFGMYYSGEFYIIPEDTVTFELGLSVDYDPEQAVAFCNFNGNYEAMSDCIKDGKYIITTGVDTSATTGYYESTISLYVSMYNNENGLALNYFRDVENLEMLISEFTRDENGNVLGTWAYADEAEQPAVNTARITEAAYVVKYVDQDGNPVAGVMCQVCNDVLCQVFVSDENGVCEFTLDPYPWEIHTLMAPAGYTADTQTITTAPMEGGELVFTLTKN